MSGQLFGIRRAGERLCACWCILALFGSSRIAASLFPNPLLRAGARPVAVATGDFNSDGLPDLAAANRDSDDVSVFLSLNGTAFASERRHPVGDSPQAIVAADVTGDGRLDLIVANRLSNDVSILPGLGDGSFGLLASYEVGSEPVRLVAHDFDGSGVADVAVVNWNSADVSVLLAGEGGSIGPQIRFPLMHPVGLNSSFDLALGDVDGDEMDDLVVSYIGGYVSVLLGRPGGSLDPQPALPFSVGVGNPSAIGVADFDGDRDLDLALANAGDDSLYILDGNGDATFEPAREMGGTGGLPLDLAVGDFNQDGLPDVVVSGVFFLEGRLGIYLNRGDGEFVAHRFLFLGTGLAAESVAIDDFDRDGVADLALPSRAGVSVLMGIGDGTFGPDLRFETGSAPTAHAVADLNEDGVEDIVVTNEESNDVSVLLGVGDGRFLPARRFASGEQPRAVAVGDFDRDQVEDFAVANHGTGDVAIFRGGGGGHFEISERLAVGGGPASLIAADLDRNGAVDLAVGHRLSSAASILLGRGDGTFDAAPPAEVGSPQHALGLGDFNRDGIFDLVAASFFSDDMTVLLGTGGGMFDLPARYPLRGSAGSLVVDDFDGDGFEDVALTDCALEIWKGLGDGSFESTPPPPLSVGCANGMTSGDFDLDGVKDLAAANAETSFVGLLLGVGHGQFEFDQLEFMTGHVPSSIVQADFNADGRLDLSVTDQRFPLGGVVILLNQGPFPNRPPVAIARADSRVECTSPSGAMVVLDGSESSDPDSEGTSDADIVAYEWFENFDSPTPLLLGKGRSITAMLPLGVHEVALLVTDSQGVTDVDVIEVTVEDTEPPTLSLRLPPSVIWPPDHRMVEMEAVVQAIDVCSEPAVALMEVSSSEPDDAEGMGDGHTVEDIHGAETGTLDYRFSLRSERDGAGVGRVYAAAYSATDSAGNSVIASGSVVVPHDVAGVTEPLLLTARESDGGTTLEWTAIEGAVSYTVARGDVRNLATVDGVNQLGQVVCIASETTQTHTADRPDFEVPEPGAVFFYVARYQTQDLASSYGSASVPRERRVPPGGEVCP